MSSAEHDEDEYHVTKRVKVSDTNDRHTAWVSRIAVKKGVRPSWIQKKQHRKGVVKTLTQWDNQIYFSTSWLGLSKIVHDPKLPEWKPSNWRQWPFGSAALDQAGENVSGDHCLRYFLQTNFIAWWDRSHGCQNNVEGAAKAMGWWPLIILMLMICNIGHSPDRDEGLRYSQMQETLRVLFSHFTAGTSALFQSRSRRLIKQYGTRLTEVDGADDMERAWALLMGESLVERLPYKRRMAQFMASVRSIRKLVEAWWSTHFKCELLALEEGFLTGGVIEDPIKVKGSVIDHGEKVKTTSSHVVQVDTKLMRSCNSNAVAIATIALGDHANLRKAAIFVAGASPLDFAHSAIAETRDAFAYLEWLRGQVSGGLNQILQDVVGSLSKQPVLQSCGFFEYRDCHGDELEEALVEDAVMARAAGRYMFELVHQEVRRSAFLRFCWPARLFFALGGEPEKSKVVRLLDRDYGMFLRWSGKADKSTTLVGKLRASSFHTVPTLNWVHAFKSSGWKWTCDHMNMLEQRASCLLSSVVCEESINIAKNQDQIRARRKRKKPQYAMAAVIGQKLLTKRWKFGDIETVPTHHVKSKFRRLNVTVFGYRLPRVRKRAISIDLRGIQSTAPKAPYFSPTCANIGLPAADQELLYKAHVANDEGLLTRAVLGSFGSPKYPLLFRTIGSGSSSSSSSSSAAPVVCDSPWMLSYGHYPQSSAIVSEVGVVPVDGASDTFAVRLDYVRQPPFLLPITDWSNIKAKPVVWLSVSEQQPVDVAYYCVDG